MIKANFSAYSTYVTDSLHQWDIDQVLQVTGLNLTNAPEVHFSNANMDRAIVRQSTMTNHVVNVNIPNSLLQDPLRIYAHIGIYEGSTFKVVEVVEIPVQPRKRPMDYQIEDTDEELYSFKRLENEIANMATKAQVANIVAGVGSDAELVDVRYGADGKTYASAGEAVREQVAGRVNKYGEQEVTPQNLQIVEAVNPNFFDFNGAEMTPIYGAFSRADFSVFSKNTVRLNYPSAAQFSIELDNTDRANIFYRITADKPMKWVRMTSAANSTTGSTLGADTYEVAGAFDITTSHFLAFYVEADTTITVRVNEGTTETEYHIKNDYLANVRTKWAGKKIAFLGDSITVNTNGWQSIVSEALGLAGYANFGAGGATINGISDYISATLAEYDGIFVMGGTNDMGQAVPIGDIAYTSGYDKTTFKGSIAHLIQQLQNNAPSAKIIFGTPLNGRGKDGEVAYTEFLNSLGLATSDYAKAMREVCSVFGVPCVDVFSECGINGLNRLTYISDTVHPNVAGQQRIGACIANGIKKYEI